ncbi:sporulation histidine kinase inhibitor Sda [Pullulanibacillus sp. KACC 23026]|nr:sporulation histidine kinase inhibitor Sda [Pullulanibacillus sp. KACC 23026]WEG12949.1 sporulation histidine kinase inhibitor Sda [Pullulanibacillus sp. KACC 23026]
MEHLSNEFLIEVYYKSILYELNPDFIQLLKKEIIKRDIPLEPSA